MLPFGLISVCWDFREDFRETDNKPAHLLGTTSRQAVQFGVSCRCVRIVSLPSRVWSVRYNHSHDQLVLTGSSDSRVILSNMVSISSEPFGHLVDDDDLSDQEERRPEEK